MTKNCTGGTLYMEDGYIRFVIKDNPDAKIIFACNDVKTFNHINSLKDFYYEQERFNEFIEAKIKMSNYMYLYLPNRVVAKIKDLKKHR